MNVYSKMVAKHVAWITLGFILGAAWSWQVRGRTLTAKYEEEIFGEQTRNHSCRVLNTDLKTKYGLPYRVCEYKNGQTFKEHDDQ